MSAPTQTWVFYGTNAASGTELWVTDGSAAGTTLVKDIVAGAGASAPSYLVALGNGKALFVANDSAGGRELWITDGTAANTRRVKDIRPGTTGSDIYGLVPLGNGKAIFSANDGSSDDELWITDGTEAGTRRVKDINPGPGGSDPIQFTAMGNGKATFNATAGVSGQELWVTDGTEAGTRLLREIDPTYTSNGASYFTSLGNGSLIFSSTSVREVWITDGTAAGTTLLANVSGHSFQALGNGKVIFQGLSGVNDREPWITDGTAAGTVRITDIISGSTGSNSFDFAVLTSGTAVFVADNGVNGYEPWITNGTGAGTSLLLDIQPGSSGSSFGMPVAGSPYFTLLGNGKALFIADDGVHGRELWVTNGTTGGTTLVKDIVSGASSTIQKITAIGNGKAVFGVDNGVNGFEAWVTDGTDAGTFVLKDINPGAGDSIFRSNAGFTALGDGRAVFRADDGVNGYGLWITDGTTGGTRRIPDSGGNAFTVDAGTIRMVAVTPNSAPVAGTALDNRQADAGTALSFQLPGTAFTDADAGDALTYSAALSSGDALPGWLSFDPATRGFSGTPTTGAAGTYRIRVRASDRDGATADAFFDLTVRDTTPSPPPTIDTGFTSSVTVDGVRVEQKTETDSTGATRYVVEVPVITGTRTDNRGLPGRADIPLVRDVMERPMLEAGLPVGVGLRMEGTGTGTQTPRQALDGMIKAMEARVAGNAGMASIGRSFLANLPANSEMLVRAVILNMAPGMTTPPGQPIVISASASSTFSRQEALVIDASALPSGTVIELQDVEFAAIVGAVRVTGGTGSQTVVGDGNAQYIVLGADDDVLHGGAGDDVVGSQGGDDQLYGDEGNDRLFGGEGNDTLDGGGGVDAVRVSGTRAQNLVTERGHAAVTITALQGLEGIDTLQGVEILRFDDGVTLANTPTASMLRFDEGAYLARNPDVAAAVARGDLASGAEHFQRWGAGEGRGDAFVVDEAFYRAQNPDVDQAIAAGRLQSAAEHFVRWGNQEGRNASALFDTAWYLAGNPDVAAAVQAGRLTAYDHYNQFGWREDRDPSAWFDTSAYKAQHRDVAAAGMNPLIHFLDHGVREGRLASAVDAALWG